MRNITILLILLFPCSCAEEKQEFIEKEVPVIYNSEIFYGNDALIYGKWHNPNWIFCKPEYDVIDISPIANYRKYYKGELIQTGKIDTLLRNDHGMQIAFCPDGITSNLKNIYAYFNFRFQGLDTFFLYHPGCEDCVGPTYTRIK
jgi:hypothetical protein